MKKTAQFISIVLLLGFSFGGAALAVEQLTIPNDDVKVYKAPNVSSPVLTILKKGQTVTAGVNPGAGFKKVLIVDGKGKKSIGYVSQIDLKPGIFSSPVTAQDKKQKKGRKPNGLGLKNHYAFGFLLGLNYQNQSASSIGDSSGNSATLSGFSGTNLMLGLVFAVPLKPTLSLETSLIYKPTKLTGNGVESAQGVPQTTSGSIAAQQTFLALSETLKIYNAPNSDWWYGPGLEIDHGMSGSLQFGTGPADTYASSDLKNLFMVYGATGYDFMSSKRFYITPTFRLGALINGSPFVIEADVYISGAWRF